MQTATDFGQSVTSLPVFMACIMQVKKYLLTAFSFENKLRGVMIRNEKFTPLGVLTQQTDGGNLATALYTEQLL